MRAQNKERSKYYETKYFNSKRCGQNYILSHVNVEIYEGDFTVIMGPSGSGKSTLLYALSGMDRATAGQVLFQDSDIVKMKRLPRDK